MAETYLHGVYGEAEASNYSSEIAQGTLPVFIGTMPLQRMKANPTFTAYGDYINTPILISSYRQIVELGIYSDDWANYTLCEALYAHFMNGQRVVAPIVIVNMLNPVNDIAATTTSKTVDVSKQGLSYVGYIDDPLCCIDDLTITAESTTLGAGDVSYGYEGDSVKIVITKAGFDASTVTATYKQIEFAADDVTATEFADAVNAIDYCELKTGLIPTMLVAPVFSEIPEMHDLIVQKTLDLAAEKWHIISVSDIPSTSNVATIANAIQWKNTNQYNSKLDKLCWPRVAYGDKEFHLSVIATYTMMATDLDHEDIPYVSPSNKAIIADRTILADGSTVFFMEFEANKLNEVGITTTNVVKQQLRLWGPHMSNYNFGKISSIKPEDRFDLQLRMLVYMLNYLQYNYYNEIDETFSRKDIDAITNSVQMWLDSLVNMGALLYAKITFDEASNPVSSLENGDLLFNLEVTYGVNAKSITFKVRYTRTGLATLFEGGAE